MGLARTRPVTTKSQAIRPITAAHPGCGRWRRARRRTRPAARCPPARRAAEQQQSDIPTVEDRRDAAGRKDQRPEPEREAHPGQAEQESCQQTRGELGREHARATRREQERRMDRPVAVLADDKEDPGEAGEDQCDAAGGEKIALSSRPRRRARLRAGGTPPPHITTVRPGRPVAPVRCQRWLISSSATVRVRSSASSSPLLIWTP